MALIISFLVELSKWLGVSVVLAFFARLIVNGVFKQELSFLMVFAVTFLLVASAPFIYWKYKFASFDRKYVEACESGTYLKIYAEPPREMVAFRGKNPSKYAGYYSGWSSTWDDFDRLQLKSMVVFDLYESKALDGIKGQWKKLTRVGKGGGQCAVLNAYIERQKFSPSKLPEEYCVDIKVLDNVDDVNFISEEDSISKVYGEPGFVISRHNTKVRDISTGQVFIEIQQILADFPRFPYNFYAGFVGSASRCVKLHRFVDEYIQESFADSIVFNKDKVMELKEKGYEVQY